MKTYAIKYHANSGVEKTTIQADRYTTSNEHHGMVNFYKVIPVNQQPELIATFFNVISVIAA